jgi:hypothetical protein
VSKRKEETVGALGTIRRVLRLARRRQAGRTAGVRLLVACVAAAATSAAIAAPAAELTLRVEPFLDRQSGFHQIRFSGTIPSPAANEYVSIVGQVCGGDYPSAVAGALTTAGGAWQAVTDRSAFDGFTPATYRAKWEGRTSEPVAIRPRLPMKVKKIARGRYRVTVEALKETPKLRGRVVELQRLSQGQWRRVQSARLGAGKLEYLSFVYSATFAVRGSGTVYRAAAPAKTAAPCYSAGTTKRWRS